MALTPTRRTYPQLTAETTVQNSDLLATYRGVGPLKKLTASALKTYTSVGLANDTLSNVTDVVLTDRINAAVRTRGAGFYNVLRLTSDDIDMTGHDDMSATLQGFIDTAQAQNKWLQLPGGYGIIRLDSPVTAKYGRSNADLTRYEFRLDGNECYIKPRMTDFALKIIPQCPAAEQTSTGNAVGDLAIHNLWFDLSEQAGSKAILLGATGFAMEGFKYEEMGNVLITSATTGGTLEIRGTVQHMDFLDVVQRENGGLYINSSNATGFCGDFQFRSCSFRGTAAARPFHLRTTAAGALIRGIDFQGDIYGTGTLINPQPNGAIGDLWFSNTQWDGPDALPTESAIQIFVDNNASIYDFFFQNPYIVQYDGRAMEIGKDVSGVARNIQINGGIISQINPLVPAVNPLDPPVPNPIAGAVFSNLGGVHFRDVQFRDIDSPYALNFDGTSDFSVSGCRLIRRPGNTNPAPDGLVVLGNGANNFNISNNVAEVLSGLDSAVVNNYNTGNDAAQVFENNVASTFTGNNALATTLPSANPIVLPFDGSTFNISGTTSTGLLAAGRKGRVVTLIFAGALTVSSGTGTFNSIRLAGGLNFTSAAGSTLTIRHNGVQWYEIGRSA